MLFTIHTLLHGYNRVQSVHLRPPTEANLILCHYSNTFNLLGINLQGWPHYIVINSIIIEALAQTSILQIEKVSLLFDLFVVFACSFFLFLFFILFYNILSLDF